ncbi:hypothetical protein C1H46_019994 [Malus baccata]|uniref:Uncharacterized protein n=1 Tax=Malus baccata TaxID=106549 RepID=A0A540M6L6_MALBA|nr:hypothetical protein C1H46_019994 [Malus baccata]
MRQGQKARTTLLCRSSAHVAQAIRSNPTGQRCRLNASPARPKAKFSNSYSNLCPDLLQRPSRPPRPLIDRFSRTSHLSWYRTQPKPD